MRIPLLSPLIAIAALLACAAAAHAASVAITAQSDAAEGGAPGGFVFTRDDTVGDLTVEYFVNDGADEFVGALASGGPATCDQPGRPPCDHDLPYGPASIVIPAGASSVTLPVQAIDDSMQEPAQGLVIDIISTGAYTVSQPTASIDILDNGDLPRVAATMTQPAEEATLQPGIVTFTRNTEDTASGLMLHIGAFGSATPDADYVPMGNTIVIAAGQNEATLHFDVVDDNVDEPVQTIDVEILPDPTRYTITTAVASIPIIDDDPPVPVVVTVADQNEGTGAWRNITFDVALGASSEHVVVFDYETVDGTAVAGSDYNHTTGTLTFLPPSPASTSQQVNVSLAADLIEELDEQFCLRLLTTGSSHVDLSPAPGPLTCVTIYNDDLPRLKVTSIPASRSESVGAPGVLRVQRLDSDHSSTLDFDYVLGGTATLGTGAAADGDVPTGPSSILAGQAYRDIPITVQDDATREPDETIILTLVPASTFLADTADRTATFSIIDNDFPRVTITSSTTTITEGEGVLFDIEVHRDTQVLDEPLVILVDLSGGTATAGSDFVATAAQITIPAGATAATFQVRLLNDFIAEADKTIEVAIRPDPAYRLGSPSVRIIDLLDDDVAGFVFDQPAPFIIDESPLRYILRVRPTSQPTDTLVVTASVSDPSEAMLIGSTSRTFDATNWLVPQDLVLRGVDDTDQDGGVASLLAIDVDAALTLAPEYATVTTTTHGLETYDNDATVSLTVVGPATVREGSSSALRIARDYSDSMHDTEVRLMTTGTAVAGRDHGAIPTKVTIPSGQASVLVPFEALSDRQSGEAPETVKVEAMPSPFYQLGVASVTFTIEDSGAAVDAVDPGGEPARLERCLDPARDRTGCPQTSVTQEPDQDQDGIPDALDLCPYDADPGQGDMDNDTLGDACDPDRDGDGVWQDPQYAFLDPDNCPDVANADQLDTDGDGIGDACDDPLRPRDQHQAQQGLANDDPLVAKRGPSFTEGLGLMAVIAFSLGMVGALVGVLILRR